MYRRGILVGSISATRRPIVVSFRINVPLEPISHLEHKVKLISHPPKGIGRVSVSDFGILGREGSEDGLRGRVTKPSARPAVAFPPRRSLRIVQAPGERIGLRFV